MVVKTDFNGEQEIDMNYLKIISYNNTKNKIYYNAKVKGEDFWVDFTMKGKINDIDKKLEMSFSPVKFYYAKMVDYNATKNDNGKKLWISIKNFVKSNESLFFFKNGNFRHMKKIFQLLNNNKQIFTKK